MIQKTQSPIDVIKNRKRTFRTIITLTIYLKKISKWSKSYNLHIHPVDKIYNVFKMNILIR